MQKANNGAPNLFMSVIEMVIGILLLFNPVGFTSGIIIAAGAIMTLLGIASIIGYFKVQAEEAKKQHGLSKGLILTIIGVFCLFKSGWFIATFPILTIIYGVFTLITGVGKLQTSIDMCRTKQAYWFVALIGAILTLVAAVIIISNPFTSTVVMWNFIAITLIVEAVIDIVTFVFARQ